MGRYQLVKSNQGIGGSSPVAVSGSSEQIKLVDKMSKQSIVVGLVGGAIGVGIVSQGLIEGPVAYMIIASMLFSALGPVLGQMTLVATKHSVTFGRRLGKKRSVRVEDIAFYVEGEEKEFALSLFHREQDKRYILARFKSLDAAREVLLGLERFLGIN